MRRLRVPVAAVLLGCLVAFGCTSSGTIASRSLSGVVTDEAGLPVEGALVRLQGTTVTTRSDAQGRFRLAVRDEPAAGHVTAWKSGFFNGGTQFAGEGEIHRIGLKPLLRGDDADYRWISARLPPDGKAPAHAAAPCETCHTRDAFPVVNEWLASAHARAATNPFFLSVFNGERSALGLVPQLGYKRDFPKSNGNCATCHVPALALKNAFDADPNRAREIEREGVFCDFCHKVADVTVDATGGRPGVLSMRFSRPPPGEKLFFGPFDDAFPGPDSFHPLFKESRYCAGCHNGRFWNVAVYSEFDEWAASGYARRGVQCQNCHMKPDGMTHRVALEKEGSIRRDPLTVASHAFPGIADEKFMRDAVELQVAAVRARERIEVTVTVRNRGAGHHLPTGNPMRNLVLLVDARDAGGGRLELLAGERLPVWAGRGAEQNGNYAGLPGKGYAKVLQTLLQYPADRRLGASFAPIYPAPHWRPVLLESDNRIPAEGSDTAAFSFASPLGGGTARVSVRLIYRRVFRSWQEPEAQPLGDLLMAEKLSTLAE